MLVNQERKELAFLCAHTSVRLGGLVQHDVSQLRLHFLSPKHIFKTELDCVFRVILELDVPFVLLEVLLRTKSTSNFFVTRFFPATGITVDWRTINDWLAKCYDPSLLAFAVDSYLSFARGLRTWLLRVACTLASVAALSAFFTTPLSTPFFEEILSWDYAFARLVTDFLALVSAFEWRFTYLTTIVRAHFAVHIALQLFTTVAESRDHLQTRRTVALMALQATRMLTVKSLLARAATVRWRLAAFYWGIKLCDATRAKYWLDRYPLAWFAKA